MDNNNTLFFSRQSFIEYWTRYFPALLPWNLMRNIKSGLIVPLPAADIHMSSTTTFFELFTRLKLIFCLAAAFLAAAFSSYAWVFVAVFIAVFLDYATFYQFKLDAIRNKQLQELQTANQKA
jgi:hypothetical protein